MRGSIMQLAIAGYRCSLYLPSKYYEEEAWAKTHGKEFQLPRYPLVLLFGERNLEPIMTYVEQKMPLNKKSRGCKDFIILGIEVPEWERDFSPWRADAISRSSKLFSGHAGDFLSLIQKTFLPHLQQEYRATTDPQYIAVAGYSLAGLCALYTLYGTTIAANAASISGSLWFKGWIDFITQYQPAVPGGSIYLSLGTSEKDTPNAVMATVDDCTRKTFRTMQDQLRMQGKNPDTVFFEYSAGGHFDNVPLRIANALLYLEKE